LSVAFGVFEVVIWRLPVDSYTFVARGADGRVSEHVVSHDAHVASALRQKINSLLDDPERLKKMGVRSRERVEHFFSWTSIARWTMDFYWDLVQG